MSENHFPVVGDAYKDLDPREQGRRIVEVLEVGGDYVTVKSRGRRGVSCIRLRAFLKRFEWISTAPSTESATTTPEAKP